MIAALPAIVSSKPNVRFIAGGGPERENWKLSSGRTRHDRFVQFVGEIKMKWFYKYHQMADLYVNASGI